MTFSNFSDAMAAQYISLGKLLHSAYNLDRTAPGIPRNRLFIYTL